MNWKETRRGKFWSQSNDLDWEISPKRNGKWFANAHRPGGAEHRLPYQDFETAQGAIAWVEQYEQERAERNSKRDPVQF